MMVNKLLKQEKQLIVYQPYKIRKYKGRKDNIVNNQCP